MRFVPDLRVEAVRTLMQHTTPPLRAIAAQTGSADEFQQSRVFRQVTGGSPRFQHRGRG